MHSNSTYKKKALNKQIIKHLHLQQRKLLKQNNLRHLNFRVLWNFISKVFVTPVAAIWQVKLMLLLSSLGKAQENISKKTLSVTAWLLLSAEPLNTQQSAEKFVTNTNIPLNITALFFT